MIERINNMNRAEEDYIKTIYELLINNNTNIIKNSDLAETMNFTDQSVNEMVKKLANKDLVVFIPYKGISLTELGKRSAIRLIRAHRIWEVFLMKHLNYSWHEVHEQAEYLEHINNDDLVNRLYEYIGEPKYCGHGNPIPSYLGVVENKYNKSLNDYHEGEVFILKRVLDNFELLSFLDQENIKINDSFLILLIDNFSGYLKVKNVDSNKEHIITNKISKMIFGL